MIRITFENENINLLMPKSLLKDAAMRKFFRYIQVLEIVNRSSASDEEIEGLVREAKKAGKEEMERLLDEM